VIRNLNNERLSPLLKAGEELRRRFSSLEDCWPGVFSVFNFYFQNLTKKPGLETKVEKRKDNGREISDPDSFAPDV
jgi:hypothetical protein